MNDTPKYTPGPWSFYVSQGDKMGKYPEKCKSFTVESRTRKHMFDTQAWKYADDPHIWDEVEANVCLVAAAPELLNKLVQVVERLRYLKPERFDDAAHEKEWNRLLVEIDETIAKAEGRLT